MKPEEFRHWGHQVVDWIASYLENVESYPVLSRVKPGDIRAQLPPNPPAEGEPFDRVNSTGRLFLTHTRLRNQLTLRLCVAQTNTHIEHVRQAWDAIRGSVGSS